MPVNSNRAQPVEPTVTRADQVLVATSLAIFSQILPLIPCLTHIVSFVFGDSWTVVFDGEARFQLNRR